MSPIERGKGTTDSERYLAKLGDRTFLKLWSYPNLYIDKMVGGQGKELCDLLVVCGCHVLIFSDKTIKWPDGCEKDVAWKRWYKKAVKKSVDQVCGAARWIGEHPDRIFLDSRCQNKLPLQLPRASEIQLHGIVVARGAGHASQRHYKGGTGSLMITPDIRGDMHYVGKHIHPFAVGDVNPDGIFIHVLDDGSLDVVMRELDTISDLTGYLSKKETLVRSDQLIASEGEEDLVAYYMTHMDSKYEHGFTRPDGSPLRPKDAIAIEGVYSKLKTNRQYIAKKQADDISYLWDNLVETFTKHMLAGTTMVPEGEAFNLTEHEQAIRYMALAPRFDRRKYGEGIKGALEQGRGQNRFTRAFISAPHVPNSETGFFFMTLAVPDFKLDGGYSEYRIVRHGFLEVYALSFLHKYRHLKRIIGIATEPLPDKKNERRGSSEDLVFAESPEWTNELVKDLRQRQEALDVMKPGQYREYAQGGQEWPDVERDESTQPKMNRRQRRALAAKKRKNRKWGK